MRRFLAAVAAGAWIGCAAFAPPKTFLPTDSKITQAWLNEVVDVDWQNVPLFELSQRGPLKNMNCVFTGVDGESVVSLEATRVTRHQVLWRLAEKYGLTMRFSNRAGQPWCILITNRETRRANEPLK